MGPVGSNRLVVTHALKPHPDEWTGSNYEAKTEVRKADFQR